MNKLIRKLIDRILGPYLTRDTKIQTGLIPGVNKGIQILLSLKYKELLREKKPLPKFDEVEFRTHSQNGEDGILLYIFSLIGSTNKKAVEICIGNGIESNTANLIINHGWQGLLFDGDEKNIQIATDFYRSNKDTFIFPPKTVKSWITVENINDLITTSGFSGEIDLLSLDVDGVDYWLWKALDATKPRVIMVEYHEEYGFEAVSIPYAADFSRKDKNDTYFGASLPAFVKLAKEKGYRLVGSNRQKFNAFFVREGIGQEVLPEIDMKTCLRQEKPEDYTLLKKLSDKPFDHV